MNFLSEILNMYFCVRIGKKTVMFYIWHTFAIAINISAVSYPLHFSSLLTRDPNIDNSWFQHNFYTPLYLNWLYNFLLIFISATWHWSWLEQFAGGANKGIITTILFLLVSTEEFLKLGQWNILNRGGKSSMVAIASIMALLSLFRPYWALLGFTGPYWALLGLTSP